MVKKHAGWSPEHIVNNFYGNMTILLAALECSNLNRYISLSVLLLLAGYLIIRIYQTGRNILACASCYSYLAAL